MASKKKAAKKPPLASQLSAADLRKLMDEMKADLQAVASQRFIALAEHQLARALELERTMPLAAARYYDTAGKYLRLAVAAEQARENAVLDRLEEKARREEASLASVLSIK